VCLPALISEELNGGAVGCYIVLCVVCNCVICVVGDGAYMGSIMYVLPKKLYKLM